MGSRTAEVQWHQYLWRSLASRLRVRGYRQTSALFAKPSYTGFEKYRVADLRYYAFQSLTLGIRLSGAFPASSQPLFPDRWGISYDQGFRDTRGDENDGNPY